jgi:hypothetical protein
MSPARGNTPINEEPGLQRPDCHSQAVLPLHVVWLVGHDST